MTRSLNNIYLAEFNRKLRMATFLGINNGTYNNQLNQTKFIHTTYTCASFSISTFDSKDDEWDNERFKCENSKDGKYADQLRKSDENKDDKYNAIVQRAQYLAIVKVILTGDDLTVSKNKSESLTKWFEENEAITNQSNSFIRYAENCMNSEPRGTCEGYIGLDLEKFDIVALSAEFEQTPPEVSEAETSVGEVVVDTLKYSIYVFIAICLVMSIGGKAYSKQLGSDNVKAFGMLFFSLYTWDFYSDVMFNIRLADEEEWTLFTVGMLFIFVPWFMNLFQLFQAQKKWTTDMTIQEGVRGWFVDWSIVLVIAVVISGNSFGAIELANVCMFVHVFLNEMYMKKYSQIYLVRTSFPWASTRGTSKNFKPKGFIVR